MTARDYFGFFICWGIFAWVFSTLWKKSEVSHAQILDDAHRAAERENWERQNRIAKLNAAFTGLAMLAAGAACIVALLAYKETWRQANAAVEQLEGSKFTEQRTLRAYLYPVPIGVLDLEPGKTPKGGIRVMFMGQTPAYNVRGLTSFGGFAYPAKSMSDLKVIGPADKQNSSLIAPSMHMSMVAPLAAPATPSVIDIFMTRAERKHRFYTWGRVDYEDVFKRPHWFTFCYSFTGPTLAEAEPCEFNMDNDVEP